MTKDPAVRTVSNQLLIKYARLSPNEIAERTGFTPIEAAEKVQALLDSRDWLSERQEERLVLIEMSQLVQDARERMGNASDRDYAAIANVVLRGIHEMAQRNDARRKMVEVDITTITSENALLFGRAFDIALKHIIGEIRKDPSDLSDQRVNDLIRDGLYMAREVLEEKVAD